jgi:beta-phosphoglucomutase-like phosphatase (HAD superfamily)
MGECHANGIAMAVASSATSKNVEFIIEALELRPYLRVILTGDEASHPKPNPEIYLKTATKLGLQPAACVAFEDPFVGVGAAKRAGMKCLGIASTFPAEDLRRETHAGLAVPGFEVVSLQTLRQLFDSTAAGNRH